MNTKINEVEEERNGLFETRYEPGHNIPCTFFLTLITIYSRQFLVTKFSEVATKFSNFYELIL